MNKAEDKGDKRKVFQGLRGGDLREGCFRLTAQSRGPRSALSDGYAGRDPTRTALTSKGVREVLIKNTEEGFGVSHHMEICRSYSSSQRGWF